MDPTSSQGRRTPQRSSSIRGPRPLAANPPRASTLPAVPEPSASDPSSNEMAQSSPNHPERGTTSAAVHPSNFFGSSAVTQEPFSDSSTSSSSSSIPRSSLPHRTQSLASGLRRSKMSDEPSASKRVHRGKDEDNEDRIAIVTDDGPEVLRSWEEEKLSKEDPLAAGAVANGLWYAGRGGDSGGIATFDNTTSYPTYNPAFVDTWSTAGSRPQSPSNYDYEKFRKSPYPSPPSDTSDIMMEDGFQAPPMHDERHQSLDLAYRNGMPIFPDQLVPRRGRGQIVAKLLGASSGPVGLQNPAIQGDAVDERGTLWNNWSKWDMAVDYEWVKKEEVIAREMEAKEIQEREEERRAMAAAAQSQTGEQPVSPIAAIPGSSMASEEPQMTTPGVANPTEAPAPAPATTPMETQSTAADPSPPAHHKHRPFSVITPQEIEYVRPDRNSYYCPELGTWAVVTPWPPVSSLDPAIVGEDHPLANIPKEGKCNVDKRGRSSSRYLWDEDEVRPAHHFILAEKVVDPRFVLRRGTPRPPESTVPSDSVDNGTGMGDLGGPSLEPFPQFVQQMVACIDSKEPMPEFPNFSEATDHSCWWSLYVCSGCGLSVLVSPEEGKGSIECVLGRDLARRFQESRWESPQVGLSSQESVQSGWDIIHRSLRDILVRGEKRSITIQGKAFSRRLSWDPIVAEVFATLGYVYMKEAHSLMPPKVDLASPEGRYNRARVLRAWMEISVTLHTLRLQAQPSKDRELHFVCKLPKADILPSFFGGNYAQKVSPASSWQVVGRNGGSPAAASYAALGIVSTVTDSIVEFAYSAQCRTDRHGQPRYIDCLEEIYRTRDSPSLQHFWATEKSKGVWGESDLEKAYELFGFGSHNGMETDMPQIPSEVPETRITDAFATRFIEAEGDPARRSELKDAVEVIAKARKSELIRASVASLEMEASKPKMTAERAYQVLETHESYDDDMLIALYDIRVMDQPLQKDTMKEALTSIAEARSSKKLSKFLETGQRDYEEFWDRPGVSADRPVGLTNIGNTCYLASMLQYFFTIRQLRETILNSDQYQEPDPKPDAVTAKKVGGRLVTSREIERSKRFVALLQHLFFQLIHSATPAIEPERDLAYLALVSSKDEADSDASLNTAATHTSSAHASSSSTEATLVDEQMNIDAESRPPPLTTIESADRPAQPSSAMDVDQTTSSLERAPLADKDVNQLVTDAIPEPGGDNEVLKPAMPAASTLPTSKELSPQPPPLPPRPESSTKQVNLPMMFGRQNDVSECMDNVMFQIEAALDMNKLGGSSVVQNLFYGKMKQVLEFDDPTVSEPVRVQNEPFAYLLVDVAEEGRTLYDGLDTVFDDSPVEIEGNKAQRRVSLLELPPVLQVQLQRVQYNRETKRIYKSNAFLKYESTLRMDRYLDVDASDADAVARKNQTKELRRGLEEARNKAKLLSGGKDGAVSERLRAVARFTSSMGQAIDVEFLTILEDEAVSADAELDTLKRRIADIEKEIEDLWKDATVATYELASVFMHRGEANFGHYYLLQRALPGQADRWLKFNDEQVTDVDASEVFADTTGSTANPYWLSYVRTGQETVIDAIRRELDA